MTLIPFDPTTAAGAAVLTRRGIAIPVYVSTPTGLIACWHLYQSCGGLMVSRQSDGRESNGPVEMGRVLVDEETAEACRQAEEARKCAAQYVVRCSGRVYNGRAHGWKSVRGRR